MPLSTVGLAVGALVLGIGLVLVLLPLSYGSPGTAYIPAGDYRSLTNDNVQETIGLIEIHIPPANLSFGGASLSVSFTTQWGTPVNASLYSWGAGEAVWDGNADGAVAIQTLVDAPNGMLTDNMVSPGTSYDVLFIVTNHSTPVISVTWTGAVDFPYAYVGLPLVIAGAVILVAVVSVLPAKADRDEYDSSGVPVQEAYVYETPVVLTDPMPAPAAALPAPSPGSFATASAPPPQFAPRPAPAATADRRPRWKAIPLHRAPDADSSPSHSLFHRPAVATPSTPAPSSTPAVAGASALAPGTAAAPVPGAEGKNTCPQCGLAIGDDTWAFCPRCRTEFT